MEIFDSTVAELAVEWSLDLLALVQCDFLKINKNVRNVYFVWWWVTKQMFVGKEIFRSECRVSQTRTKWISARVIWSSRYAHLAFWIHQVRWHGVADEESLALHDDVWWWLMSSAAVWRPNGNLLAWLDLDCAVEFEQGLIIATAADQLPTPNLGFLKLYQH